MSPWVSCDRVMSPCDRVMSPCDRAMSPCDRVCVMSLCATDVTTDRPRACARLSVPAHARGRSVDRPQSPALTSMECRCKISRSSTAKNKKTKKTRYSIPCLNCHVDILVGHVDMLAIDCQHINVANKHINVAVHQWPIRICCQTSVTLSCHRDRGCHVTVSCDRVLSPCHVIVLCHHFI